jgi:uncharacterized protein
LDLAAHCRVELGQPDVAGLHHQTSLPALNTASKADTSALAHSYTAHMHPLIETHRAELLALARRRGVTGVRVFGSMSRGDGNETSDVDLLVTLSPGTSGLALGGLLLDAQELLGRRVDIVTEASLHPALRERVVASAVPL